MNALLSEPDPADWERLRPLIDDAIHELDERDREAVLLRYFENRPFAEIGATLRLSADAARMRVDRALEKLRAALARRGVTSTSAALATVLTNQVAASAPVGLATAISGTVLAGAGLATGGLATVGAGIFMSMKTTAILSAVALAALVAAYFQWNRAFRAESELAAVSVDRDGLRVQLRAEQQRAKQSAQAVAMLQGEIDALKSKPATATTTPRPTAAPSAAPAATPDLTPEELDLSLNLIPAAKVATDAYRSAHNGQPPPNPEALIPYFSTPQAGADFLEWFEAQKAAAKKN